MSQLFASGGQSIWVSASTSVLPMNTQDWSPLGWTAWISLQSKGLSRGFSNTTVQKLQFFCAQLFIVQPSHPYMTTEKTIALTRQTFVDKVILLFNMLSRLVITFKGVSDFLFHGCNDHLQWFGSPDKASQPLFPLFPHLFAMKWWDRRPWSYFSECWALSQLFHSNLSFSSRGSLVLLHFLP